MSDVFVVVGFSPVHLFVFAVFEMVIESTMAIFVFVQLGWGNVSIVSAAAVHRSYRLHHCDQPQSRLFLVEGFGIGSMVGLLVEGQFSSEVDHRVLAGLVVVIGRMPVL